jgi:hypothetical protein
MPGKLFSGIRLIFLFLHPVPHSALPRSTPYDTALPETFQAKLGLKPLTLELT